MSGMLRVNPGRRRSARSIGLARCHKNGRMTDSHESASPTSSSNPLSSPSMETSLATDAQKAAISNETLASRHEALIRLAEVIRSKPEEEDLFESLVSELHQVVPYDSISQLDPGANRVCWRFLEPYKGKVEAMRAVSAIPRDETA